MSKKEALSVQKLLFAASKIEETLDSLGLNEEDKSRVGTYFFALRTEIDKQFSQPPTVIGNPPEGFERPKPTYEDLERSLEDAERRWMYATIEVGKMRRYWNYQSLPDSKDDL